MMLFKQGQCFFTIFRSIQLLTFRKTLLNDLIQRFPLNLFILNDHDFIHIRSPSNQSVY